MSGFAPGTIGDSVSYSVMSNAIQDLVSVPSTLHSLGGTFSCAAHGVTGVAAHCVVASAGAEWEVGHVLHGMEYLPAGSGLALLIRIL